MSKELESQPLLEARDSKRQRVAAPTTATDTDAHKVKRTFKEDLEFWLRRLSTLLALSCSLPKSSRWVFGLTCLLTSCHFAVPFVGPYFLGGLPQIPREIVSLGVSYLLENISDGYWIYITTALNQKVRGETFGKLDEQEREVIRSCESLDTVLRVTLTKLPVAVLSIFLVCGSMISVPFTSLCCISTFFINSGLRWLLDQTKALKAAWQIQRETNTL